jgi:hypothetical protein
MANTDQPFGFVPIGTTDGSDYHGKLREVEFLAGDAVAAFIGDMVKLTGTTGADGFTPVVAQAAAGNGLIGAIVEFLPDFEDETFLTAGSSRLASTARKARVCFGSDVLYIAQASTTLVAADAGQNADIIVAAGSTITGISAMEIGAVIGAGATGQVRLHHVFNTTENELGADAQWVVSINENQDDHGTGV